MRFLFDLFGELFFMLALVAVFAVWEYVAYRMTRRIWMWVAGLMGIAVLIWLKGYQQPWSWLLGAGWLGVLVWCDHKLHVEAAAAAATHDAQRVAEIRPAEAEDPRQSLTRRY
jgi:hypothetical protein